MRGTGGCRDKRKEEYDRKKGKAVDSAWDRVSAWAGQDKAEESHAESLSSCHSCVSYLKSLATVQTHTLKEISEEAIMRDTDREAKESIHGPAVGAAEPIVNEYQRMELLTVEALGDKAFEYLERHHPHELLGGGTAKAGSSTVGTAGGEPSRNARKRSRQDEGLDSTMEFDVVLS
ncbi:hypothetical protein IAT38_008144 [Cryptococcus sp. DSM 104549]